MLDQLLSDLRYTVRGLRRSPGFTAAVIVTLGLGIGANTAMFGVVDQLMFRPLAYLRAPASVNRVYFQWNDRGSLRTSMSTQYRRYLDLRRLTSSFSDLAIVSERSLAVGLGAAARERRVGAVSASYFNFFDARPVLGRFFTEDEDVTPRGADVVVLSNGFWRAEFGGRNVLGRTLHIGEIKATIIGVAPSGFAGMNDADPPAVFVPITTYAASTGTNDSRTYFSKYSWSWANVLVRRKPGVSEEAAAADATHAFRQSWTLQYADERAFMAPVEVAHPRIIVSAIRPGAGPDPALEARTALWVAGVAAIVLLIACANVANLLLARALRRERETAVRLALGVSRGRLLRQSLTESLALATIGGVVGLVVAHWGGSVIRSLLISTTDEPLETVIDWRSIRVTLSLAVGTGVLTGIAPSLLAGRTDLAHTLRAGGRGVVSSRARARTVLLVVQAALSVTLLVGAGLFVRSLKSVESLPLGYDADRVLLVNRVFRGVTLNDTLATSMRRTLLAAARELPVVEAAAWVSSTPFASTSSTGLYIAGIDSVRRLGQFSYQATTADYFRVMGTRILRGRGFTDGDRAGAPRVAVVSKSMAQVLWPGREAIGQCMRVFADTMPCTTIIGITEDIVQQDLTGGTRYHYYMPIEQFTRTWGFGMLLKLRADPASEAESIRKALQRVVPGASYVTTRPLRDTIRGAQRSWRLGATMFAAFGALALIVAAVGLYGVIAYNVNQRMHELSVRVALGAQRTDVLRLIVGQTVRVTLAGVVLGSAMALAAGRWIQPLLFGESARDPRVFATVGVVMVAVALVASLSPAIRAANADPNLALRAD